MFWQKDDFFFSADGRKFVLTLLPHKLSCQQKKMVVIIKIGQQSIYFHPEEVLRLEGEAGEGNFFLLALQQNI